MKALYPISGNPPTWGHAELVSRATKVFTEVEWALAVNPAKSYLFPLKDRLEMLNDYIRHYALVNVTVSAYEGSTARYAMKIGAKAILRGLRNATDLQAEMEQAMGNQGIASQVQTVAMFTSPAHSMISSSLVRELALLGEDITPYVHPQVAERIRGLLDTVPAH